jgi:predicted  nucleic acid-binding Zn ribbon protein
MVIAFTGHFGLFKAKQYKARKEIKAMIKAGVPDSLRVNFYLDEIQSEPKLFIWIHSKEFRYKGQMYDVVSEKEENGRVVLSCIHDVKESGLFADLDNMIQKQMNSDSQHQNSRQQWIKLFQSLFYDENPQVATHQFACEHHTFFFRVNFLSVSFNPESPPPEFIC